MRPNVLGRNVVNLLIAQLWTVYELKKKLKTYIGISINVINEVINNIKRVI